MTSVATQGAADRLLLGVAAEVHTQVVRMAKRLAAASPLAYEVTRVCNNGHSFSTDLATSSTQATALIMIYESAGAERENYCIDIEGK